MNEQECKIIIYDNKIEMLNENGLLHSFNDIPAIEHYNGNKCWYNNGKCHRENEPAVVFTNGSKFWFKDGNFHNANGPAADTDEKKQWYKEGKLHRLDGPAIEWSYGKKEYWIENIKYSKKDFMKAINKTNIKLDFNSASYRVIANQISKIVKNSILVLLKKEKLNNTKINNVEEILNSEIGSALISMFIGYSLSLNDFKINNKLVKEFRIESMSMIGNEFVDNIIKYIIPCMVENSNCRVDNVEIDNLEHVNQNNFECETVY